MFPLFNSLLTPATDERWLASPTVFYPGLGSRDQFLTCPFSIRNPPQIALRCSLCISYLHWINATHWRQVFESMFINGFFKCLKIKSLTYWWSFQSCPGREKELELERVLTSSWTAASRLKTTDGSKRRRRWAEEFFWEEHHPWGAPFRLLILAVLPEKNVTCCWLKKKTKSHKMFRCAPLETASFQPHTQYWY